MSEPMSPPQTLKDFLPSRLMNDYAAVRQLETVRTGKFNPEDLPKMQNLINDAQPTTHDEEIMKMMVQYFYRRNPREFYNFLRSNKLYHLVLWTEAKTMAQNFRVRNLIYLNWNGNYYECHKHNKLE